MRIRNSIYNIIAGIGGSVVTSLLSFVSRTVFIYTIGVTYLGLNGLILNVLAMLNLTELGIGAAINYSLYKPLLENDTVKIKAIMKFYQKAYVIIGLIVFGLGLILMLFLKYIIKDPQGIENLNLIYLIFLFNTAYTYFFTYKRTLISADQKGYLLVPFTTGTQILMVVFQIVVLVLFKNYILYLLTQTLFNVVQNIVINRYIDSKYPYLRGKDVSPVPREDLNTIKKNIKATFLHNIGDYAINSTDNIIISAFISIVVVGVYSNYLLIITTVNTFIMIIFNSTAASFGNLIAEDNREKSLQMSRIFDFMGFWIFGWATICFYNLLNPFIAVWLGQEFLIDQIIITVVLANYYLTGMRMPISIVKVSAGVYAQDQFVPLIQAAINLVFSIILVQKWGLVGVFAGTLISSVVLPCWYRPIVVYTNVFQTSAKRYFIKYLIYGLFILFNVILTQYLCALFFPAYTIGGLLGRFILCLLLPNLLLVAAFFRTDEFKELTIIIKRILGGIKWKRRLA